MAKQTALLPAGVSILTNITQRLWGRKPCRARNPSMFPLDATELPLFVHGVPREKHKIHGAKLKQQPANFCAFVGLVPSTTPGARRTVRDGLEIINFLSIELEKLEHKILACDYFYMFSAL